MSKYIKREKYDYVKNSLREWRGKCSMLQEKLIELSEDTENSLVITEALKQDNEKLLEKLSSLEKENLTLKQTNNMQYELESDNESLIKTIKHLKKSIKKIEVKHGDKLMETSRDIMLKDAKIQRLEEANNDLKERYNELKKDFRERQRWSTANTGS